MKRDKWRKMWVKIKNFLKQLLNWRFALCFGIAWMITNGWSYVFVIIGNIFHIKWMIAVGTGYLAFLWMPFTPEKLVTIPIAIGLLKLLFPKHKQLQDDLQKQLKEEKDKIKKE